MPLNGRSFSLTARLRGAALFCMGMVLLPAVRESSASQPPAAPVSVAKERGAERVLQTPLSLRFAVMNHIKGEDPQLPFELLQRYHGETVLVSYQVCVNSDGTVLSVHRRSGIAEVDPIIISTLRTWQYPPQPPKTLTCVHEVFEFSQ